MSVMAGTYKKCNSALTAKTQSLKQQAMEVLNLDEMNTILGGKTGGNANEARSSFFFMAGFGIMVTLLDWLSDLPVVK